MPVSTSFWLYLRDRCWFHQLACILFLLPVTHLCVTVSLWRFIFYCEVNFCSCIFQQMKKYYFCGFSHIGLRACISYISWHLVVVACLHSYPLSSQISCSLHCNIQELSQLRFKLCPRFLKDHQFWTIYFALVKDFVAK